MNQMSRLVRLAKGGDAHAFSMLYEMIYKDLYRFALYTLKHTQDAEDVVSETVTDAFVQIRSLREAEAFKSWMFRILTVKCSRRIRQYMNRDTELEESFPDPASAPEENMDVRQAFGTLAQEDRLILSMNLFAGYSSQEIADILGMNPNTVRSRQSRALSKLKKMLEE